MSLRQQRLLATLVRVLGLLMIVVDLIKSGRSLTAILPQTESSFWTGVNAGVYGAELFLDTVGRLLPGHAWMILGVLTFFAGMAMGVRTRAPKTAAAKDSRPVD